jgi:membrane protease YdiL (CAAX protease family)
MLLLLLSQGYRFKPLFTGWRTWGWWWILIGLLAGVSLAIILPQALSDSFTLTLATKGLSKQNLFLFILIFLLVTPTLEEPFWRDYLGKSKGLLSLSDIAFSGYHLLVVALFLPNAYWLLLPVILIGLSVVAAFWRWLFRITQGLMIPWLSHATADLSVMLWVAWQFK